MRLPIMATGLKLFGRPVATMLASEGISWRIEDSPSRRVFHDPNLAELHACVSDTYRGALEK